MASCVEAAIHERETVMDMHSEYHSAHRGGIRETALHRSESPRASHLYSFGPS